MGDIDKRVRGITERAQAGQAFAHLAKGDGTKVNLTMDYIEQCARAR